MYTFNWLLVLIVPFAFCQAQLNRVILKEASARCLDGSPGVYYLAKGEDH